MEAVIIGGAIGVAFQQLYDSIVGAIRAASGLKFQLQLLESKVRILNKKFQEIAELLTQLEHKFPAEILKLQQLLEKAKQLVSVSCKVSMWNYYKKMKYKRRLAELDKSLEEMLGVDFPAAELKYTIQVFVKVVQMNKKLDSMFDKLGTNVGGADDHTRSRFGPRFQLSYSIKKEKVLQVHIL